MDETLRFLTRCEAPSTSTEGWPGLKTRTSDTKIVGISLKITVPPQRATCGFITEALLKLNCEDLGWSETGGYLPRPKRSRQEAEFYEDGAEQPTFVRAGTRAKARPAKRRAVGLSEGRPVKLSYH